MRLDLNREPVLVIEAIKKTVELAVIFGTLFGVSTLDDKQADAIGQAAAVLVPVVMAIDFGGAAIARSKVSPVDPKL